MSLPVIDADGHVIEDESIVDYIEEPYRSKASKRILTRVFPPWTTITWGSSTSARAPLGAASP